MPLSRLIARFRKNALNAKLSRARIAEEHEGILKALEFYSAARADFPSDPDAHAEEAACLLRLRRFDEVDKILAAGLNRFPYTERIWIDYAVAAERRGAWAVACERWRNFNERFPDRPRGHTGLAEALREFGKVTESETVLTAAHERWAQDETIAVAYAREATSREEWPEAEQRWAAVRTAFPARVDAYTEGARAAMAAGGGLERAAALLAIALKRFPPSSPISNACLETANAFVRARRFEDAEKLLAAALPGFPHDPRIWIDYAQLALYRQDFTAAIERWQEVRQHFPDKVHGYCFGAHSLRGAGRLDESEKLALEAMPRFPEDFRLWYEYGLVAQARRDWPEALRRFAELRDKFPDRPEGYSAAASTMGQAKQHAEAAALLEIATGLFPGDERMATEWIWNSCHLKDWPEAIRRCAALRERFPKNADGYALGTLALLRSGKLEEAEALATAGMNLFPRNMFVMTQYAWCAAHRREWDVAIKRWEEALAVAPTNQTALDGLADARHAMMLESADQTHAENANAPPGAAPAATPDTTPDGAADAPELLRRFESLGDNCEFGLVQRLHGLEPLGLLRWATTYPHKLIAMLQAGFDGVGLIENTTVYMNPAGEWSAADKRYFSMHTFIYDLSLDPQALIKQMARRFLFLKNKLVEDLESGEKIFIYKRHDGPVPDAQLAAMSQQLKRYNPNNKLLTARRPERPEQEGTVVDAGGGIFIGYIEELGTDPQAVRGYFSKWRDVCKIAWQLAGQRDQNQGVSDQTKSPADFLPEVDALRKSRDFDGAEKLLEEALELFPDSIELLKRFALLAEDRKDRPAALERWQRCVAVSQEDPETVAYCCGALRQAKRYDEAESLASSAIARFPEHVHLGIEYALVAQIRRDSERALQRWKQFRDRHPQLIDGYAYAAHAAREAARYDEAEALAQAVVERFPDKEQGWAQLAWVCHAKKDWPAAALRWQSVRDQFPNSLDAHLWGAYACAKAGRDTDAEQILQVAIGRFPDSPHAAMDYANLAAARHDWHEASIRWQAAVRNFPNSAEAQIGAGHAAFQLRLAEPDTPDRISKSGPDANGDDVTALMKSFEGLGDNCEFGLVQRRFKAEPVGLLRWSGIGTQELTRALENRFPGTGDPENTWMTITPTGEYFIRDRINQFFMHTFIPAKDSNADAELERQSRRLRYLRDNLIEDLEEGEKIFVYKPKAALISDQELAALHAAIRSYGATNLLCIRLESPEHPNGDVEVVDDGLLIGYIDRVTPNADSRDIAYDSWLTICKKARQLVNDRMAPPHQPSRGVSESNRL